ncbi:MAG: hypothetical protein WDZ91_03660 [Paenibacillaceae bacterium]
MLLPAKLIEFLDNSNYEVKTVKSMINTFLINKNILECREEEVDRPRIDLVKTVYPKKNPRVLTFNKAKIKVFVDNYKISSEKDTNKNESGGDYVLLPN